MYLFKSYAVREWIVLTEVYGVPLPVGKYESGTSRADRDVSFPYPLDLATEEAGEPFEAEGFDSLFIFLTLRYHDLLRIYPKGADDETFITFYFVDAKATLFSFSQVPKDLPLL